MVFHYLVHTPVYGFPWLGCSYMSIFLFVFLLLLLSGHTHLKGRLVVFSDAFTAATGRQKPSALGNITILEQFLSLDELKNPELGVTLPNIRVPPPE